MFAVEQTAGWKMFNLKLLQNKKSGKIALTLHLP
jgi:hypothetical protein